MTFDEFDLKKPKPMIAPDAPVGDIGEAFALALKRDADQRLWLRDLWLNYAKQVAKLRRQERLP